MHDGHSGGLCSASANAAAFEWGATRLIVRFDGPAMSSPCRAIEAVRVASCYDSYAGDCPFRPMRNADVIRGKWPEPKIIYEV